MPFDDRQTKFLTSDLDTSFVKLNQDGQLYIEGYTAFDQANTIFGFHSWDTRILRVERTVCDNGAVLYSADVEISVTTPDGEQVNKQDTGTQPVGSKPGASTPKSEETARKGAITDAYKRCLRQFGNQFGNSLYDKASETNAKLKRGTRTAAPAAPAAKPAARPPTPEQPIPCDEESCPNMIVMTESKAQRRWLQPSEIAATSREKFNGKALCKQHMAAAAQA